MRNTNPDRCQGNCRKHRDAIMCKYCTNDNTLKLRLSLASEAIGLFHLKTHSDRPDGIELYVHSTIQEYSKKTSSEAEPFKACNKFESVVVAAIKKTWPGLTLKQKMKMVFDAGIIRRE